MTVAQALIAFIVAAGLLTVTPGLDTALVLRTAAAEGPRRAWMASLGISLGTLAWGLMVAFGLGALLLASQMAFTILKWAGAAYLVWMGVGLILRPRETFEISGRVDHPTKGSTWLWRGLFNNLLNPKMGVFYISFLPQFVPRQVAPAPWMVMLAAVHVAMGLVWFGALIGATRPISGLLQRPPVVRWLDRITGGVFLGFGLNLALSRR